MNRDHSVVFEITSKYCLFYLYAEYIMRNVGLEEAQAGIKIARININNLRYADNTTFMADSEEELKRLLMKVKEKSLSRVRLLATPWTASYQAPLSMGFSRQEYWSGVPLPSSILRSKGCILEYKIVPHW